MLWLDQNNIIIVDNDGTPMDCETCPCDASCLVRVIASAITNARDGMKIWNLTPYQGDGIGTPGARWRIRDVGEAHYYNSSKNCTGTRYSSGIINENGKLVGLPDRFVSSYSYNGYMQLQQGCLQPNGAILWPCPNG